MSVFTALFTCFVGSAIAQHVNLQPGLVKRDVVEARQTSASDCDTAFEPLLLSLPLDSPDFISYWNNNNPISQGCLAPLPTQFSSVRDEYSAWWKSHSSSFYSIASECGLGLLKRDVPSTTSIPPISSYIIPTGLSSLANNNDEINAISSLIAGDFTGLPAQFAQYVSDFQPCPTTATTPGAGGLPTVPLSTPAGTPAGTPTGAPTGYGGGSPAATGNSTGSTSSTTTSSVPLFVNSNSGHRDTTSLAIAAIAMAGVLAALAAL
ncbi:hypothetical protein V8E54_010137 [Elaphomyces granulatus]|jgi:hypothetical protein